MADAPNAPADTPKDAAAADVDATVEGGNYEVIRKRLVSQGAALRAKAETLNTKRQDTFGGTELAVLANGRARTEHNCVPRDLVMVQGRLLLGFDVTMGLKQETRVSDVFAVQSLERQGEQIDFVSVPTGDVDFLNDESFRKDFTDLFRYYRDARLVQLRKTDTRLLAIFQVGATVDDIKVCRWRVETGGRLTYIDNRGERDHVFPPSHDFEWTLCTREMQVPGTHPHINILDTVFVETVGGDLTVKVEDNTADGQGIYREPVDDANQTLDDAEFYYARLGGLILLKIKPYREDAYRYLVYNTRTQAVARIDAIGRACVQLPEDHGIIFPGGYYLQSGEWKVFPDDSTDLEFKRVIKAPNGEDVLYVFHRRRDGLYTLLPYNLIRKAVQTPIPCHGYSLFADGTMVVFRSLNEEPTRVHPLQVWRTPFESAEHAASAPTDDSFLAKVGNADLVRGISDALSVARLIDNASPSRQTYEDLIRSLTRMKDSYYWLGNAEVGDLAATLAELSRTAELIVDEFEKVVALRARAAQTLAEAEAKQAELLANLRPEDLHDVESFLKALTALRTQRGHLITIRETRYIDQARIDALEAEAVEAFDGVTRDCVRFLLRDEALGPLTRDLENLLGTIEKTEKVSEIEPLRERLEALAGGLDLLTEVVSGLQIDDATQRTTILEGISEVFGQLNRVRATLESKRKSLMSHEGKAEFGAQFKLFGQSVQSALAVCDTPERCDDELGRLMVQLEELEARFSEFDEFLGDLAAKRDEVYEAFNTRKQTLLDERQRRAGNIQKAADRILEGVQRRARSFTSEDELNAYFASDGMIMKLRQLAEQLAQLGDGVKAEELLGKLKGRRQDALRGLRDKLDLFEGGDNLIRFGNHQFAVNTQPLELTMVPRDDGMVLHLTGTDFYEPLVDEAFEATRSYWPQTVVSEDREVYRGEYLAARILFDAEAGREGLTLQTLIEATREAGDGLLKVVRAYAQERYDEGYERGLHDQDATLILDKLIHMRTGAGLLRFGPAPRAVAALFWGAVSDRAQREAWHRKARNLGRLRARFGPTPALTALADTLADRIASFLTERGLPDLAHHATLAGRYLVEELTADQPRFTTSREAIELRDALLKQLESNDDRRAFEEDLRALKDDLPGRLALARAWLDGLVGPERSKGDADDAKAPKGPDATLRLEAAVALAGDAVDREPSSAVTRAQVTGLLGQHPRVVDRTLTLQLDEFLGRLTHFIEVRVPGYRAYRALRQDVLDDARQRLRLDDFKPRVMSAFVRNKLINDVYLPIIGDNLAKQMGAAGAGKRTDLMGLLLLISPPGYGKTSLMAYVAYRHGLVFVKVNGPSLSHSVVSL
ncbi:MAG: DNA repair ATPase, partial [Myxococcales bacterium]|nr:DNA repair ATPase [Myxococcales bacterium]